MKKPTHRSSQAKAAAEKSNALDPTHLKRLVQSAQKMLKSAKYDEANSNAEQILDILTPYFGAEKRPFDDATLDIEALRNIYLTAMVWRIRAEAALCHAERELECLDRYLQASKEFGVFPRVVQALQIKAQYFLNEADWESAIAVFEQIPAFADKANDPNAHIQSRMACANCHMRLYRFRDAERELQQAELKIHQTKNAFPSHERNQLFAANLLESYEISKLTGDLDQARRAFRLLNDEWENGVALDEDNLCSLLLVNARDALENYETDRAARFVQMLRSTKRYQTASDADDPCSRQYRLQKAIIDIEAACGAWQMDDRETAYHTIDAIESQISDKATRQTTQLLRYAWAVETGADAGDVSAMGERAHALFSNPQDSLITLFQLQFIDAQRLIQIGKYDDAQNILQSIREAAGFRGCIPTATRAHIAECDIAIQNGKAHLILSTLEDLFQKVLLHIGPATSLLTFCTLFRVHTLLGNLNWLNEENHGQYYQGLTREEVLCVYGDTLLKCLRKHDAVSSVRLGLPLLQLYSTQCEKNSDESAHQNFESLAEELLPFMDPRKRAYSTMIFHALCAQNARDSQASSEHKTQAKTIARENAFLLPPKIL